MCSFCLEMEHGAAGGGELEGGLIIVKAGALPLKGTVVGRDGADEGREQVDGAVEVVEERPGDSVGENGENIVDSEGEFKGVCGRR